MSKIPSHLISIPRSGQHMTERILKEFYRKNNLPYSYCEFYNCCNQTPCKLNKIYQKSHDFDLKLTPCKSKKHIFLYRKDKIEQIEAWFRMFHPTPDYSKIETYKKLLSFYKSKSLYYDKMIKKYSTKKINILSIEYNRFLKEPENTLYTILSFLDIKTTRKEVKEFIDKRNEKISKRHTLNQQLKNTLKKDLKL